MREPLGIKNTLIGEIVDRKDGSGPMRLLRRYQERNEAGVPIIRVNNVRLPAAARFVGNSRCNMIEKPETKMVVSPVGAVSILVETPGAVIEARAIDQPNRNARIRKKGLQKPCLAAA